MAKEASLRNPDDFKMTPSGIAGYFVKLSIGVALFIYVAMLVDWRDASEKLDGLSLSNILISLAIVVAQAVLLALRWRLIGAINGISLPLRQYTAATLISFFFSQGLPASLGADAFRVWWYGKNGIKPHRSLQVIAFDRIVGLVSLAATCLFSLAIIATTRGKAAPTEALAGIVALAIGGFVLLVLPLRIGLSDMLLRSAETAPTYLRKVLLFLVDLRLFFRRGSFDRLAVILILGLLVHVMTVLLGFVLASGLGAHVDFTTCLAAIAPGLLVSYVPISIAGWGVREASLVLAFGLAGVGPEVSLLISLGIGTAVLLVSLIGGVIWIAARVKVVVASVMQPTVE